MNWFDKLKTCLAGEGKFGKPGYHHEPYYSAIIARATRGQAEYRLADGRRVDVLTERWAIEVEWAHKWPEAIGQATSYALATGRSPCVYLLYTGPEDDRDYALCREVCLEYGIRLVRYTVEPK